MTAEIDKMDSQRLELASVSSFGAFTGAFDMLLKLHNLYGHGSETGMMKLAHYSGRPSAYLVSLKSDKIRQAYPVFLEEVWTYPKGDASKKGINALAGGELTRELLSVRYVMSFFMEDGFDGCVGTRQRMRLLDVLRRLVRRLWSFLRGVQMRLRR